MGAKQSSTHIKATLKLEQVLIPPSFKDTSPRREKVDRIVSYYQEHGSMDKPITVKKTDKGWLLTDGYIRYLAAEELDPEQIEAVTSEHDAISEQVHVGVVKYFQEDKGYGFIKCDATKSDIGRDVFVHTAHLSDGEGLKRGQRVQFKIEMDKRGPQAREVTVLHEDRPHSQKLRQRVENEDMFLGRHGEAGVCAVLINDSKIDGRILDWDRYNILLATDKNEKLLIRKEAVKYWVAPMHRDEPDEPLRPTMRAGVNYLTEAMNDEALVTFVFPSGKVMKCRILGVDTYNIRLQHEELEILLLKHAYMYVHRRD